MANKTAIQKLRESERDLESQLAKLRARISKAERGENKRIKDANRYIARTLRNIERTSRAQERLQERELEKLERFLGETFESVTEAREALSKQTRKATKRERLSEALKLRSRETKRGAREAERLERESGAARLDPQKPSYTIRQLSRLENQQVIDFLSDKKTFHNVGLNYLQPNERITVSVPYKYIGTDGKQHTGYGIGRKVFRSWDELQLYIRVQYFDGFPESEEWLGRIEIIKFPTEYQYAIEKGRQQDVKNTRRKGVRKMFSDRKREAKKKDKARSDEKLAKKNVQLAKERAKNKELKRQLKGWK